MREGVVALCAVLIVSGCAGVEPRTGRGSSRVLRQGATFAPDDAAERRRTPGTRPRQGGDPIAPLTHEAVIAVLEEVKGTLDGIARTLPRLAKNTKGLGDSDGVFTRYTDYGASQLPWLRGALARATSLTDDAATVEDMDMRSGILRLTGPRIEAAMSGAMLLATWLDFLRLAEVVRQECPYYGVERLFVDLDRVQRQMEPAMTALASLDPEEVEATATAMPGLMGQLTREFQSIQDGARGAMERGGRVVAAAQFLEMLTLVSALKATLPRPPPAAPVMLGVGLMMGSGGVMMGSRIVVTAEWVERMRTLVQAGVISAPVVSAAVRIHAGQVLMAQANQDLPKGVRDALGDSPEVRAMRETGRAGAGMSSAPKHHVLPQEHREWFERRGFKGEMDIDQFCVRLEQSHHEAIHGGGDWRLGRLWAKEWNQNIMRLLRVSESDTGRLLTRDEILKIVATEMRRFDIPMTFSPGKRR
ncbi:DUF2380 domain-containing protein [Corallococcus carmarthensis]|uniref:DUF2380 domain-containing protein n=1 Tax=Corallococcus carmarthensis TaxID=2316728 RepID=A0A3A8JJE2_9BACT|nr:DUF2380 domain-containing protein [Corallococcus carmarthensis]NOK22213.1 DUF2380 domain-containing protein [Corallococcus carmarthensis]RKG95088.1 DUF2380 domain-containing protein [Corallococcus carmarthensis]